MRKILQFSVVLLTLSFSLQAQSDSATYTTDTLSTDWENFISIFDKSWNCTDTLTVTIPAGNYVTGVDVYYQITADSNAWVSEQGSYLECLSSGNQEAGITDGDQNWDSAGTMSYARTNLQIATGASATGNIEFHLHAFREFGNNPVCGNVWQYIPPNSWKIVVHHTPPLTCFAPDSLYFTNRTPTSMDLGWRTGGSTNWQIEYGPKGFTPGTGTIVGVNSNPYTLTGLSATTDYDFRVRDSCGVNDVSFWSPMKSFQTGCITATAPFAEDFDGASWTTGIGNFGIGTIDTCWERNWRSDFVFKTAPKNFTSTTTGPASDHTSGSGKWMTSERVVNSGGPYTATLSTRQIDLSALTVPELTFWYHMFGADIGDLDVEVSSNGGVNWTNVFSRSGQQQASQQDPWQQAIVSLSAYANNTVSVRFTAYQALNGGSGDIALDDFDIHEQPTCPQPTNLAVSNITATTADISWTTGGATNWQIEYGPAGFTSGTGTLVSAGTNPFTLTGLSPATTYDIYVRDSCAPTDLSLWTGPVTFSSGCAVAIAPYSQNFDGPNWIPGTGFGAQGSIDTCWTRNTVNTYFWKPGPPQFAPGNTGPNGDHTTGNGKYVYTETSGGSSVTQIAELETPPIDVSGLTQPFLTFWYHMFGANVGDLEVEISSNGGSSFSNVFTRNGQQHTSNTDPWTEANVDLIAYTGDTIIIRFKASLFNFGTACHISIDDVLVDEAPPCQKPSNLALNFTWIDYADLSWTAGSGADWELEYGAPGFALGSGTRVPANSTTNFKLTGLSPNTSYEVYVRDSCGAGNVSAWVGPISFTTLCQAVPAAFTEDFDGASWNNGGGNTALGTIANCWVRDTGKPFVWKAGPPPNISGQTGPSVDHTTGSGGWAYSERVQFFNNQTIETYLQTPPVDLSTIPTEHLNFWYHMYGNSVVDLVVDVNNGSGWTQLFSLTGQQQTSGADAWKEATINLSTYANDTVVIRWKSTNNNGGTNNDVAIDDVLIDTLPSCPKPTNFSAVGNTQNTVTLGWTTGGATDWNVSYGAPGFSPNAGTIVNAAANPLSVAGLSPNTAYSFYVRDSCGSGDVSPWVGPVTILMDCVPQAAPFAEDFDGSAWTLGTTGGGGAPGAVANCWRRDEDSSYIWTAGQNGTASGNTGPSGDNTSGTGKYVYTETYFGGFQGNVATLTTPLIDLGPLVNPELKFFYHLYGADITTLEVRIFDGTSWTTAVTYTGQQQTASADAWKEQLVDLVPYLGDTIKVEFRATKAVGFSPAADMAIDDLSIDEKPACPKPDSLVSTGATATSIDLSWISGGASNWQIMYRQAGSTGNFTTVAAGTNPFTVTGLSPSTTYEFYIRDSCGVGVVSDSVGPALANTLCLPVAAPYFENFDGANFDPGPAGFGVAGTIDACWTRNTTATYFWKPGPSNPQTGGTGPSGDHTSGSGGYLFTESGGFAQPPLTAEVVTPEIDLSPLTNPELTFWYHMFGGQIGNLDVEISDDGGVSWSNLVTITGQQQTSNAAAWLEQIVSLSAYVGDTVSIRFSGNKTAFGNGSDISIDDVEIDEAPNCPKPSALMATSTTSTSITLSWTTGGATDWQIEYGTPGFVLGTGTLVAAGTNPFTVTGLTANTGYEFYVRDSCGVGSVSDWATFSADDTTDCNTFAAPFFENFDGASWDPGPNGFGIPGIIDGCWDRDRQTGYYWKPGPSNPQSNGTGPSGDHTSGNGGYAFTESGGFLQPPQSGNLETSNIDLGPLTAPELRFWYHMTGPGIGDLDVEISNDNGMSFTNLATISGQQQTAQTSPWLERVVSLNSYINDTVIVRFKGTKNQNSNQADIAIDDVSIADSTGCEAPDSIWVVSSTTNSITVGWNSPSMAPGAIIFYRPAGSTGPFSSLTSTSNPAAISGLSPSASYEIYIQDSCGLAAISLPSSTGIFSTQCGAVAAPWSENFDNPNWVEGTGIQNVGDQIDPCWTRPTNTGIRWTSGTGGTGSAQTGPAGDYNGGGNYIYTEASIAQGTSEIETPRIFIPAFMNNPKMEFYYHMYGVNITSLAVEIDDGTGYTNQLTITGQQQTANNAAWILDSVDLTSFSGDTIQIKFVGINAGGFRGDIAVDQISIDGQAQQCLDPTMIAFSNIGNTSIDVSWISTSGSSEIEVVPAGNVQGTGTLFSPVTSPFTVTGLAASTAYDIYIRDICGTLFSNWVDSSFTTTNCPAVVANFTWNANLLNVNFNSSTTIGQDSVGWSFGDGNISLLPNPNHTYAAAGTYIVSLFAGNACGNSDTFTQAITVCDSLIPDFSFTISGDTVYFDGTSTVGATTWLWDFGVGGTGAGANTSYVFPTSGSKPVILTVVNACGDSLSIQKVVKICKIPVADWTYNIISTGAAGMQVQFDATASLNAVNFEWDFGDGSPLVTGTSQPVHTYLTPGLFYRVRLTITNACGDKNTKSFRLNQIGLEDFDVAQNIQLYPNPAKEKVTLEWPSQDFEVRKVEISEVSGKMILQIAIPANANGSLELDMSQFPSGSYFLKIETEGQVIRKSLMLR